MIYSYNNTAGTNQNNVEFGLILYSEFGLILYSAAPLKWLLLYPTAPLRPLEVFSGLMSLPLGKPKAPHWSFSIVILPAQTWEPLCQAFHTEMQSWILWGRTCQSHSLLDHFLPHPCPGTPSLQKTLLPLGALSLNGVYPVRGSVPTGTGPVLALHPTMCRKCALQHVYTWSQHQCSASIEVCFQLSFLFLTVAN